MSPPPYFERVRAAASREWELLESNPTIAGPWHQLFKQVQSPRHVLSELLQNADDAGATEASVQIHDRVLTFCHNGTDFTEEHFTSLCRFGYSNKRALHTIGFRGIGFKSVFSLGSRVELTSPSLRVAFEKARFTEPVWFECEAPADGRTQVGVRIANDHLLREAESNLSEWKRSPLSLLFFKTLRSLTIGNEKYSWVTAGTGPVSGSEWLALAGRQGGTLLLARSDEAPFPGEAVQEIQQERLLGSETSMELPPCRVEVVFGEAGRLHVVLPTSVMTKLPFAVNAPFVQDPARLKIKEPSQSPTNRWLLDRVGKLAASVMLDWLAAGDVSPDSRAQAYGLLPTADQSDASLGGACSRRVTDAFDKQLAGRPYLLTEAGTLVGENACIGVPGSIEGVWPTDQTALLFDRSRRPAFSSRVSSAYRDRLVARRVLPMLEDAAIFTGLESTRLPRPQSWSALQRLWEFVAPAIASFWSGVDANKLHIVPVQSSDTLFPPTEVIRLGERKFLKSEEDWHFMSRHLNVMSSEWQQHVAKLPPGRSASGTPLTESVSVQVLKKLGLAETSDVNTVIRQVSAGLAASAGTVRADWVRLAQITACLGASVGPSFRYVTQGGQLQNAEAGLVFDPGGRLSEMCDPSWYSTHALHPEYALGPVACTAREWQDWVDSDRANLRKFVPLVQQQRTIYGAEEASAEFRRREGMSEPNLHQFRTRTYILEDWDFDESHWRVWRDAARENPLAWVQVLAAIMSERSDVWMRSISARLVQMSTTGSTRSVSSAQLIPNWILKLRELTCLRDTHGTPRKPSELLRRTPANEALRDVQDFVEASADRESFRPLLQALGVGEYSPGPGRILDRLRSLAGSSAPPAGEVEKWYRRLDQLAHSGSSEDLAQIARAFQTENIILTRDSQWVTSAGVFLAANEEDAPGAPLVRESVGDLTLWGKVGVADRPTADLALRWLLSLRSGSALPPADLRRVRALMARLPQRIWHEVRHWLNLPGQWTPVEHLKFAVRDQDSLHTEGLFPGVIEQVADFRGVPERALCVPPFVGIASLSQSIEERIQEHAPEEAARTDRGAWVNVLGTCLQRLRLDGDVQQHRIWDLGRRLASTRWIEVSNLNVLPYIAGTPVGTARSIDVLWSEGDLWVRSAIPRGKLAKLVPTELGRHFGRVDLRAAFDYCFERGALEIREYMTENFALVEDGQVPPAHPDRDQGAPSGAESRPEPEVPSSGQEPIPAEATPAKPGISSPSGPDVPPQKRHVDSSPSPQPALPMIEQFARTLGLAFANKDLFRLSDGRSIRRCEGGTFPWAFHDASGAVLKYLKPEPVCLDQECLVIEAEAWDQIERSPAEHSLIVFTRQKQPVELTGVRLKDLRKNGKVTLHPASYRIVQHGPREAHVPGT